MTRADPVTESEFGISSITKAWKQNKETELKNFQSIGCIKLLTFYVTGSLNSPPENGKFWTSPVQPKKRPKKDQKGGLIPNLDIVMFFNVKGIAIYEVWQKGGLVVLAAWIFRGFYREI